MTTDADLDTDRPEYSVWEFYPDDSYTAVVQFVGAEAAVKAAHACTQKPAVQLGIIVKVMITDGGDACVFEWRHGVGVVYPPREDVTP
jgi:hypothetical protein